MSYFGLSLPLCVASYYSKENITEQQSFKGSVSKSKVKKIRVPIANKDKKKLLELQLTY